MSSVRTLVTGGGTAGEVVEVRWGWERGGRRRRYGNGKGERGGGRRVGWRLTGAGCDRDEVPGCRASITTSGSDVIDSVLHYI